MANNRISVLVALEAADDGLKRALKNAEQSLGELATSAKTAGQKAAAGMEEVKAGMSAFGDQVSTAKTQLLAFLSLNWAAGKVQELVQVADAWNQMNARLKLATTGQNEFNTAQNALFGIAQRIGVPIQETATLYGKLQQAVRMLGLEQTDALSVTESISQALRISGASATESQSALLQFGQALASGMLRGEEFNSVVENSPRLAKALADGLDVPIGRLRKMAEEGRLTADVVVQALMSQKDKLASEYGQLPATVSQAFERLKNAFGQWVSTVDASTGMTTKLAGALTWLSQNLQTVMNWLKLIAEVGLATLIYRLIPAMITAWQTAGAAAFTAAASTSAAWATVNLTLDAAVASVGRLKTAFLVFGAFAAGWEIGTWLSEKFEVVRKAGVFMVEIVTRAVEQLQYRWEAFAAIFTSDTIDAATKRHETRLAEMNAIFAQMYLEASKGSDAAAGAMNAAATTAEEISRRLEAVRQGTQEAVGRSVEAVHGALQKLEGQLGAVEQAAAKANGVVNDATAKMAESYKGLTSIVQAQFDAQTAAVKARFQQEQLGLDQSSASQAAQIARSTQLLLQATQEQTQLRRQATTDTLALIDAESKARLQAAARQGATEAERSANVTRAENEILATRRQTLLAAAQDYQAHIDQLNAQANRHLAEVQRIEEVKRQLSLSTEDRVREIQRQGMTDFEAFEDRKRQVTELQTKAREALASGEFDQARHFAQQAMDLASQVASHQSSQAKAAQDARGQAEQEASRIAQLESQARAAASRQEYATSTDLMHQADQLREELAQKARASDAQIAQGKQGINQAIEEIRASQSILNEALDGESQAHKSAAAAARDAGEAIRQTLQETDTQIAQITEKLKDGLKITLDADSSRFERALADLDAAMAQKQILLAIQLDLQQAQKQLQDYEQILKSGQTLPIDADLAPARKALASLSDYAKQNALIELGVSTDKAKASIANVEGMITALNQIKSESQHLVRSNVPAVRTEIGSLDGLHTSSTHTITVRRVEANAAGGLVGSALQGSVAQRFASGGPVTPGFARMTGGTVPGSGDQDSVPRTLDAGAFVLKKAVVRHYGVNALQRLVGGIAHFATGGQVGQMGRAPLRSNKDVFEVTQMIELGLSAMREYTVWMRQNYGAFLGAGFESETLQGYSVQADTDRRKIESWLHHPTLSPVETQQLAAIKASWQQALAQPLLWGKDLQPELLAALDRNQANFFAGGGLAPSDTVPAMLTPGEFVVNKDAVSRLGVGFFAALNGLNVPARALAERVQGFASGGLVPSSGAALPHPVQLAGVSAPTRTIRVELASGNRTVAATITEKDESRLLDLLKAAQGRAAIPAV